MEDLKYVFGPVPSRRLGRSVGVSPILDNTCNHTCVYCQLGRTRHMTNKRQEFFPLQEILAEFKRYAEDTDAYDVVSVVGEGEPTLYSQLGELLKGLKQLTDKPVTVITNGALLYDPQVRAELMEADIVLPSLDAVTAEMYHRIDRPYGRLDFEAGLKGLIDFSHEYKGQLWLEIMLVDGMNTAPADLEAFAELVKKIRTDRIYINTPVRPPAEAEIAPASHEAIQKACELLGAISIDMLTTGSFSSEIEDDYEACISICRRHPMNQFEIRGFLQSRGCEDAEGFFKRLEADAQVTAVDCKGMKTYRIRR
ncbi:MAG: radical SAM protein [Lachnospiraceae bacterium]|nr:radical SAM protein [Lachnospiraceae bacterium]